MTFVIDPGPSSIAIPIKRAAANKVKEECQTTYDLKVEGDVAERVTAHLDASIDTSRCTFLQVCGYMPVVVPRQPVHARGYAYKDMVACYYCV